MSSIRNKMYLRFNCKFEKFPAVLVYGVPSVLSPDLIPALSCENEKSQSRSGINPSVKKCGSGSDPRVRNMHLRD